MGAERAVDLLGGEGQVRQHGRAQQDDHQRLHLDRRWTLEAQVENLFDKDYETAGGFQAPPRIAYLGLRYSRLP